MPISSGLLGREIFCEYCNYDVDIESIKIDFHDPELRDIERFEGVDQFMTMSWR